MTDLNIFDRTTSRLVEHAAAKLWSAMIYPDDAHKDNRGKLELVMTVGELLEGEHKEIVELHRCDVQALLRTPQLGVIHEEAGARQRRAEMAGKVVLVLAAAMKGDPKHASLGKAQRLVARDQIRQCDTDGRPMPASDESVAAAWHEFVSVAHLWAAWIRTEQKGLSEAEVLFIVRCAAALRRRLAGHRPPIGRTGSRQGRRSDIADAMTWRLPDWVALRPLTEAELDAVIGEPGDRWQEFVKDTPS